MKEYNCSDDRCIYCGDCLFCYIGQNCNESPSGLHIDTDGDEAI